MTITKIGHSCLVLEEKKARILIDPGAYSTGQKSVRGIDLVLITHEHPDHLDVPSLKIVLQNNPQASVLTNAGVANILKKEGISSKIISNGERIVVKDVSIVGVGTKHAGIYPTIPLVDNTGFFIADRFFYPGDALTVPPKAVEILALPVSAPWTTLAGIIDYAKTVHPKICFPVHDGMLKFLGPVHRIPSTILSPLGISFVVFEEGKTYEQ
ncbi:MAG TPA: MBL fold metallo-hydrolase [Patescibacteria group bacterium]|nr:MBL fold metallo-hydrolase [Patescibacteria group bacterium]